MSKTNGKTQKGKKVFGSNFRKWLNSAGFHCALTLLSAFVILFLFYALIGHNQQYSVRVGSVSQQTIKASKNVIDEVTTARKREEAAASVAPSYEPVEGANEQSINNLNTVFQEMELVRSYGESILSENNDIQDFTEEQYETGRSYLTQLEPTNDQLRVLMRCSKEKLDQMVLSVTMIVENELQNATVYEEKEDQTIQVIRQTINRQIGTYQVEAGLRNYLVSPVLRACIVPNMLIDQERTEQKRQEARDAVEPIYFYQGENIVVEGERVTENQMEALRSLGLLKNNESDYSAYGGAAILVVLALASFIICGCLFQPDFMKDFKRFLVLILVLLLDVTFSFLCMLVFESYLAPVSFSAILAAELVSTQAAMTLVIPVSILAGGLAAGSASLANIEMINLMLMALIGGVVAIRLLKGKPQRVRVLICGLAVAAINMLIVFSIGVMTSSDNANTLSNAAWSAGSGVLSAVLAMSIQPILESAFNLATPSKLLELSNPNQPLLRRLLLEAPGTYHHAIIVANLAEAAAEKIGADPLLARAGAYFHDIGKLKRPLYFKENQMGENPHDHTDPYVSAAIVTSHTRDGLLLAQKYKMPPEIQKIIVEHHGDTPVMYFYHKALQMANGNPVDINDFRYAGNPPSTREAAIIMLADTIEAAVRSMPDPTPQQIERFIEKLVRGKLEDGQLSDSPLTLRDIDKICDAFSSVLNGVFHERIEYPNMPTVQRSISERAEKKAEQSQPAETTRPLENENAKPVAEPAKSVPAEPEKPVAGPAMPATKQVTPAVSESAKPAMTEQAKPVTETGKPIETVPETKEENTHAADLAE